MTFRLPSINYKHDFNHIRTGIVNCLSRQKSEALTFILIFIMIWLIFELIFPKPLDFLFNVICN